MANFTNHTNNVPLTAETIEKIRSMYASGKKKTRIATDLGISHSVVRKYTDPQPWRIEESVKIKAREMLQQGISRSQIGRELGVSRKWVGELAPAPEKRPKKVSEEVRVDLIRRANTGEPIAKIARDLGIGADTARNIAETAAQEPSEEQVIQARELLAQGTRPNAVATQLGLQVRVVLQIAGDNMAVRYSASEKQQMAELYSLGWVVEDIAKKFGASTQAVRTAYNAALNAGKVQPRITLAMEDDLELLRIQRLYPELEEWRILVVEWYRLVDGHFAIVCASLNRFLEFIAKNNLPVRPSDFLLREHARTIPSFFNACCPQSDHGAAMNNAVADFIDWVLRQPAFADLDDPDDPVVLPIFKNPILREDRSNHKAQRGTESNKKVMPYWLIHDLRRRIAQGPNFSDWKWVQGLAGKVTLTGDKESRDWFEVSRDRIDESDPDCVWRIRHRLGQSSLVEMWSPVRWVACLTKLQITARMGQIRMIDSGEADTLVFEKGRFVENTSPIASGTLRKPRRQGFIRQVDHGDRILYFNTNKTQDIAKVGPEKGQDCPWPKLPEHADDPYYWLEKLRDWQTRYNPAPGTIAWKNVPSSRRLRGKSLKVCSTYPDVVFLFRTPESRGAEYYPVSSGACDKAWQSLFGNYEAILRQEGRTNPDGTPIRLILDGRSEISPHGLRVSLITHLILDGGVPVEMMMKIVGHVRFVMTIYYTKPGLRRIEDAVQDGVKKLDAVKDEALIRDLTSRSEEQMRRHVVFNSEVISDVLPVDPADRNAMGWMPLHDGICLAGGNTGPVNGDARYPGCHNGGPLVVESSQQHGPVPGGVRNCSRCRWKCAGKHHLLGLQATFNNRQYHLYKEGDKAIEAERKRDEMLRMKATSEADGRPFVMARELREAERRFEISMHRLENLAADLAATQRMIERIKDLPDNDGGPTALAAQGDDLSLNIVLEETPSELQVLAEVCADVEFFPDLDPGTAIFECAQLLDRAFEREGKPPVLASMSESEKLSAVNAVIRELERLTNLGSSHLARRKVIEVLDRGESLERSLGANLDQVSSVAKKYVAKTSPPVRALPGARAQ